MPVDNLLEEFNERAEEYESFTDKIPRYDEMMRVIREVFNVWSADRTPESICELGVGDGRLSRAIVEQASPSYFQGIDGAERMIQQSRDRFEEYTGSSDVDLEVRTFQEWAPDRTYDWIYSSLSIHHLSEEGKRNLFETIYEALAEGGRFLYADLVRQPDDPGPFYRELQRQRMLRMGLNEEDVRAMQDPHDSHGTPAAWQELLGWLREIGFKGVDCVWKDTNKVVVVGEKSGISSEDGS